jgi:hypothetical protein
MMGRRFTWVIVASVGALLLFAGLDALHFAGLDALRASADRRDSATSTVSTRTPTTSGSNISLLP